MFIKTSYQQESILLFKNIAKRFGSKHSDLRQNDSKVIRLDYEHYASIDISAYSCNPKSLVKTNPPQYLIAFNVPLVVSNYNF
jgi:hypothetical protein